MCVCHCCRRRCAFSPSKKLLLLSLERIVSTFAMTVDDDDNVVSILTQDEWHCCFIILAIGHNILRLFPVVCQYMPIGKSNRLESGVLDNKTRGSSIVVSCKRALPRSVGASGLWSDNAISKRNSMVGLVIIVVIVMARFDGEFYRDRFD